MNGELLYNFMTQLKRLRGSEYILTLLKYHLAPTVAGLKPATLVSFKESDSELLELCYSAVVREYEGESIKYFIVKSFKGNITILFYNEKKLHNVIFDSNNMRFLNRYGYSGDMLPEEVLEHLKSRFSDACPHEVGIFLGFPLEDVKSFIEFPDKKCRVCGYWKAYSNEEAAEEIFQLYDKAKEAVMRNFLDSFIIE